MDCKLDKSNYEASYLLFSFTVSWIMPLFLLRNFNLEPFFQFKVFTRIKTIYEKREQRLKSEEWKVSMKTYLVIITPTNSGEFLGTNIWMGVVVHVLIQASWWDTYETTFVCKYCRYSISNPTAIVLCCREPEYFSHFRTWLGLV